MKTTRKTYDITHTGQGGPVRMKISDYADALQGDYPAEAAKEQVQIAANIIARREYGNAGYCRILNLDSWTNDGSATYQAFIGVDAPGGGTSGRNIWIYWYTPEID